MFLIITVSLKEALMNFEKYLELSPKYNIRILRVIILNKTFELEFNQKIMSLESQLARLV